VDFDWARNADRMISMSGYVFQLFGGVVSWMSKQQAMVTLSNAWTKYMVATHDCKKAIRLMKLCSEVGLSQRNFTIQCDINNTIVWLRTQPFM
jgi:hypothetical protein